MNQSWENCKKKKQQILGLILVPFGPDLVLKMFFWFYVYWMLDIVASYHCMQFQGQLMNQTWENGKKPSFGPILVHLPEIRATKFFFSKIGICQSLDIMVSYHHVQYQKRLMIQSWENLVTDGRPKKFYMAKIKGFPKNKYLNMKN